MELRDIGEFGLIERVTRMVINAGVGASPPGSGFPLVTGIGDDAAAWRTVDAVGLSTTDTMVEGVHFTRETMSWQDLGWKAMVANYSDIAAMGGTPLYALITLGLPEDTQVSAVDDMYSGMIEACLEYEGAIVGGDVVRSPVTFVSISVSGIHRVEPMLRSAAKPDDLLAVTGFLGSSRAGLEVLTQNLSVDEEAAKFLIKAHQRPRPMVGEGRILMGGGVLAAIDISDGLLDDLGKMMAASGVAAVVDSWQVPVHPLLQRAFPDRAIQLALAGGEDYELLYAAPAQLMEKAVARFPETAVIGRVVAGSPGEVRVQDQNGNEVRSLQPGWDHFRA